MTNTGILQIITLTITIFVTTIDDLLWLIPYVCQNDRRGITPLNQIIHSVCFIMTLQLVCLVCGIIANGTVQALLLLLVGFNNNDNNDGDNDNNDEIIISWIGPIMAWCIGLFLYIKKLLKKRRKKQKGKEQQQEEEQEKQKYCDNDRNSNKVREDAAATAATLLYQGETTVQTGVNNTETSSGDIYGGTIDKQKQSNSYGSINIDEEKKNERDSNNNNNQETSSSEDDTCGNDEDDDDNELYYIGLRPLQVICLTLIGSLDEISYFPAILLSKTFTWIQLNISAFIACILILVIIRCMLTICTPIITWMDKNIQLYGVVFVFAFVLSIEAIIDTTT